MGDVVGFTDSFLLTDDETLIRGRSHWLRDIVTVAPDPDTALRLLLAGIAVRGLYSSPLRELDAALQKLRGVIAADVVIADARPEWLPLIESARHARRRLRFRYVKDGHAEAGDREIDPYIVYALGGHWYVEGKPVGEESAKRFRIDRISDAQVLDEEFAPPDVDIPEWFDLSAVEHSVRLRMPHDELVSIPQPHRIESSVELPDGLVEVDVTIAGDRRLDHLLVALSPQCEVTAPPELAARRSSYAAELLALYE